MLIISPPVATPLALHAYHNSMASHVYLFIYFINATVSAQ